MFKSTLKLRMVSTDTANSSLPGASLGATDALQAHASSLFLVGLKHNAKHFLNKLPPLYLFGRILKRPVHDICTSPTLNELQMLRSVVGPGIFLEPAKRRHCGIFKTFTEGSLSADAIDCHLNFSYT